jgi:hypothetical protein
MADAECQKARTAGKSDNLACDICHLPSVICHLSSLAVLPGRWRRDWRRELVTGLISPSAGGQSQPSRRGSRAAHEPKHPEKTDQEQEA